jgi:hypothetical protein
MIVKGKPQKSKIEIDLAGPQGNAFYLIGLAENLGRQLKFPKQKIESITDQMMSGDYSNLIEVFDNHFGEFVILYKTF